MGSVLACGMPSDEDQQAAWRAAHEPRLRAELQELTDASAATSDDRSPVALDQQSVGRLSRMDAMQSRAMAAEAERRRQLRLNSVRAALSRMADGEFGHCGECGEPISEARLNIDPTAYLCVRCARRSEG